MSANTIRRIPRQKINSRSKKITNIYNEDFDEVNNDASELFAKPKKSMRGTIFGIFIIGLLAGGGLGLLMNQSQLQFLQSQLVAEISGDKSLPVHQRAMMLLRSGFDGEKPISAVVKDVSVLSDLPLYEFAKNGDHVFIYKDMAVIYDDFSNRIVSAVPQSLIKEQVELIRPVEDDNDLISATDEVDSEEELVVGDIVLDEAENSSADVIPESEPLSIAAKDVNVEVRNGTRILGHAGKNATLLKNLGYNIKATNAIKTSYKESVLVDLSNGRVDASHLQSIADALSIKNIVIALPTGEAKSSSDVVIILGTP